MAAEEPHYAEHF